MCIVEYLGYVCGHSSIHVHRPCPLTTHLATNPTCPNPATHPTLVDANCPTCARILHTRWVEIVTLEHQWMHERGTCGCEVRFPALQQPRVASEVILRSDRDGDGDHNSNHDDAIADEKEDDSSVASIHLDSSKGETEDAQEAALTDPVHNGRNSFSRTGMEAPDHLFEEQHHEVSGQSSVHIDMDEDRRCKLKGQRKSKKKKSKKNKDSARSKRQQSTQPNRQSEFLNGNRSAARLVETCQKDDPSMKSKPATSIVIRLSSQYGAEWISDHAELHASGRCSCAVRFETYQAYKLTVQDIAEFAPDMKFDNSIIAFEKPSFQEADLEVWRANEAVPDDEQTQWPVNLGECGFESVAAAHAWLAAEDARVEGMLGGGPIYQQVGQPGTVLTYEMDIPADDDNPVRSQGHYGYGYDALQGALSQTRIQSSPAATYPQPSSSSGPTKASLKRRKRQIEKQLNQGVTAIPMTTGRPEYHQEHDLPLVGWPLGAGPEGGAENSHSPAWDMCILSRPSLKRSQSCPSLDGIDQR